LVVPQELVGAFNSLSRDHPRVAGYIARFPGDLSHFQLPLSGSHIYREVSE
jgi:hypothetical protein